MKDKTDVKNWLLWWFYGVGLTKGLFDKSMTFKRKDIFLLTKDLFLYIISF